MSRPLRVLVTASRLWTELRPVFETLDYYGTILRNGLFRPVSKATEALDLSLPIVGMHGGARGGDSLAGEYFRLTDGWVEEKVPAEWKQHSSLCPPGHRFVYRGDHYYCPLAGYARNQKMVDRKPDICLAFMVGQTGGTQDCINRALTAGIEVRRIT